MKSVFERETAVACYCDMVRERAVVLSGKSGPAAVLEGASALRDEEPKLCAKYVEAAVGFDSSAVSATVVIAIVNNLLSWLIGVLAVLESHFSHSAMLLSIMQ